MSTRIAPMVTALTTKGGAGKTTVLQAIASVVLAAGKRVSVLDFDPNRSMCEWADEVRETCPIAKKNLVRSFIPPGVTREDMVELIREHRSGFDMALADLPGAADERLIYTASRSSAILVPLRHGGADFRCAVASYQLGAKLLGGGKVGAAPPIRLLRTMTEPNYGVLRKSESERAVDAAIEEVALPVMRTPMRRLAAFGLMAVQDVPLYRLDGPNKKKAKPAIENTKRLLKEVNEIITAHRSATGQGAKKEAA